MTQFKITQPEFQTLFLKDSSENALKSLAKFLIDVLPKNDDYANQVQCLCVHTVFMWLHWCMYSLAKGNDSAVHWQNLIRKGAEQLRTFGLMFADYDCFTFISKFRFLYCYSLEDIFEKFVLGVYLWLVVF